MVSVLFADLVGFTPLSEAKDAEAVRELLSGYFETARTVIARYGGTVEKFIGDAVMAVWGVPAAHEDDAERSVRAALELVEAVGQYGQASGAPGLAARAGVVTGEVAVTLGASGQGMVAGDAVNTAARVQAEAEPGGVLVDDTTRQATAAAIGYVDTGPHLLKGKAGTIRLWQATRVVAAVGGSERVDGLEAGFLGRDRELRQVKDGFHDVLDQSRARLVSVVGAAGVGKSRLRWEFFKYTDGLVTDLLHHVGRCLPYGDGVAYWALAEMVRARLGITEDEPTGQVTAKLDEGLHRWVADQADRTFLAPRLGALLGVAEPGLGREELFAGWRLWFEQLADHQPVLLVVEDLQWADAGLLDFLEQLLDWSADSAIFVLTLTRPELLHRRPTWGSARGNATTVTLDRLPDPVMTQLLSELVPGMPHSVAEQIVNRADGIPLYAVELVRSLIDQDLVQPIDGIYRLVGTVSAIKAPASLTSLVAARIDALPADEQSLVQGLAVLGGTFPRTATTAVTDLAPDVVDRLLADLIRREILRVRTDRLSPDRGQYAFTQTLLRQVAYDTLSRRDRKARHLAVAAHLRATFPDDGADVAEVIAQHYLNAYQAMPDDPDAGQAREQAATAFARAGQRAISVGAPNAAESAYTTAAELTTEQNERTALVEQAGEAALQAGRYEAALDRFESAAAAHTTAGSRREAARVAGRIGETLRRLGRVDDSVVRLRQALQVLTADGPSAALAEVHSTLAGSLLFGGHPADAAPHVEAALEFGEALRLPDVLATAASRRGMLLSFANRPQEALVDYEWAVSLAQQHKLGNQERVAHVNSGNVCLTNDLPGAVEHCQAAIQLSKRSGEPYLEAIAAGNLAYRYLLTGQWEEAERLCRELLGGPSRPGEQFLHYRLAELAALRGQVDTAEQELAQLGEWADSEDVQSRNICAAAAVTVMLAAGKPDRALEIAEAATREVATAMSVPDDTFRQLWPDAMEAALTVGRLDQAGELLALVANRPVGHVPPYLQAQLGRYRARLAAAHGQEGQVEPGFTTAGQTLRELGYPYWLARVQLDHAAWLLEHNRPTDATPLLTDAAGTFERLDAQPALARARDLMAIRPAVVDAESPYRVGDRPLSKATSPSK
jgi:class 3 adenylate cyclase/tetratricopeptide (TPR) repeat protein